MLIIKYFFIHLSKKQLKTIKIMNTNRKLLIEILAELTGKNNIWVMKNLKNINLEQLINTCIDDCKEDIIDYKNYIIWESLQKSITNVDLY